MDREVNIVPGEAPESDDEERVTLPETQIKINQSLPVGIAVSGEAPESDSSCESDIDQAEDALEKDESVESISSATSALSSVNSGNFALSNTKFLDSREETRHNSLLHRKLRERNMHLRRGLEEFVNQTIDTATKDLNSIDQHLLKSQVTLQEATSALRLLQGNLSQMNSKLEIATSINLPLINTKLL